MTYINRLAEIKVNEALEYSGAVVIEGSKACGKTSLAKRLSNSQVLLDVSQKDRQAGLADPQSLLGGKTPRLIDEWQRVPEVWNSVRNEVDKRGMDGQFILTGSATPADEATRHSGAMRIVRVKMKPLTLFESGLSSGAVSLGKLFNGDEIKRSSWVGSSETHSLGSDTRSLGNLADICCRGGWPSNVGRSLTAAMKANQQYLQTVGLVDVKLLDDKQRDPNKMSALLFSLSKSVASYVSNKTLMLDSENFGYSIDAKTLSSYLNALERIWVVEEQLAWGESLRSNAQVRKSPKRHLVDPSLAVAAMDADPDVLMSNKSFFGQVFESLVYRDISVYADIFDAKVNAFQDNRDYEIDLVITRKTKWAGIEIKLSATQEIIDNAGRKLLKIARNFKTQPQFLAVISSDTNSYLRSDGVYVLSIFDIKI